MGRYPHDPDRYFESEADRGIARVAMEATGVLDLATVPLDELSGGERQRAVLARRARAGAALLVLDEPPRISISVSGGMVGLLRP